MEVTVDVVDLHCVDLLRAQPRLNIAVDLVCLATEKARAKEQIGPQQAQVVELLRASSVLHVEREAEERCPRHPNRLLPWHQGPWHQASSIHARNARLHASRRARLLLEAVVAC